MMVCVRCSFALRNHLPLTNTIGSAASLSMTEPSLRFPTLCPCSLCFEAGKDAKRWRTLHSHLVDHRVHLRFAAAARTIIEDIARDCALAEQYNGSTAKRQSLSAHADDIAAAARIPADWLERFLLGADVDVVSVSDQRHGSCAGTVVRLCMTVSIARQMCGCRS